MKEVLIDEKYKEIKNDDYVAIFYPKDKHNDDDINFKVYIHLRDGYGNLDIKEPCYKFLVYDSMINIKSVKSMLSNIGFSLIEPLIDFTKPLEQELKRLADEDDFKPTFDGETVNNEVVYDLDNLKFIRDGSRKFRYMGNILFSYKRAEFIVDYLNNHKEESLKAMEL